MKVLDTDDLTRAAGLMRLNARLMDRRRFALHFAGGSLHITPHRRARGRRTA